MSSSTSSASAPTKRKLSDFPTKVIRIPKKKLKSEESEAEAAQSPVAPASSSSSSSSSTSTTTGVILPSPTTFIKVKNDTGVVNADRIRVLRDGTLDTKKTGPVIYWMSRDQRAEDNWALLYAQSVALQLKVPLIVAFNLVPKFLEATIRQFGFMLRGLRETADTLESKYNIPFLLLRGQPENTIPALVEHVRSPLLVCDFSPVRVSFDWKTKVVVQLQSRGTTTPVHEVDAHNVVPAWCASIKQEYTAATIRPKITKQLPVFLTDFPELKPHPHSWNAASSSSSSSSTKKKGKKPETQENINSDDGASMIAAAKEHWDPLEVAKSLECNQKIEEVKWIVSGSTAAHASLKKFLQSTLNTYATQRNDPAANKLSHLSPYFHYGQLAPQRAAFEAKKIVDSKQASSGAKEGAKSFVEELVIRRELADNLCFYAMDKYDSTAVFPRWAHETLDAHRKDKREFLYTEEELEQGKTHDPLWNAAQLEMVKLGKMHGYLRMYWAKKVLEWTKTPEDALAICIRLNDRYELDGRDPNGWAGCAWAIGGVHDRPWPERAIFGKIRYMNAAGCARKFDVQAYCARIKAHCK